MADDPTKVAPPEPVDPTLAAAAPPTDPAAIPEPPAQPAPGEDPATLGRLKKANDALNNIRANMAGSGYTIDEGGNIIADPNYMGAPPAPTTPAPTAGP